MNGRVTRESKAPAVESHRKVCGGSVVLVGCFVITLFAWQRFQAARSSQIRPFEIQPAWMATPEPRGYAGYFRMKIDVTSNVDHAWLVVAARDSFEVDGQRRPDRPPATLAPDSPVSDRVERVWPAADGDRIGPGAEFSARIPMDRPPELSSAHHDRPAAGAPDGPQCHLHRNGIETHRPLRLPCTVRSCLLRESRFRFRVDRLGEPLT